MDNLEPQRQELSEATGGNFDGKVTAPGECSGGSWLKRRGTRVIHNIVGSVRQV